MLQTPRHRDVGGEGHQTHGRGADQDGGAKAVHEGGARGAMSPEPAGAANAAYELGLVRPHGAWPV